jgi:hypothetical protein
MSTTLRIDPPLPCGTLRPTADQPYARCGQPASVAQADALPGGEWRLLPICRDCVAAIAQVYGVTGDAGERKEDS